MACQLSIWNVTISHMDTYKQKLVKESTQNIDFCVMVYFALDYRCVCLCVYIVLDHQELTSNEKQ